MTTLAMLGLMALFVGVEPETPPAQESKPGEQTPAKTDGKDAKAPAEAALVQPTDLKPSEEQTVEPKEEVPQVSATQDGEAAAEEAPPIAPKQMSELQRRARDSQRAKDKKRAWEEQMPPVPLGAYPGESEQGPNSWIGKERPDVLSPRSPAGAFALGGVVGFGAGYYYSGEPSHGMVFSIMDGVLVAGFVATSVALNNLVVKHDFRSGKSLLRGEREFGGKEATLYTASTLIGLAEVGSHIFQAFGSMSSARRTNKTLEQFSFVPLGSGAGVQYGLAW